MAGTVRYTRRSLGSTCLSSPFVMSERANVRPRQRLEGCSARPSSSSARSWDDEDDDESRLSRGNRWKVTLAEKELGASPAAARRFFTVLTETSSRAEPSRGDQRFSIQFPSVTEGIDCNYNRFLQRREGFNRFRCD